MRLKSRAAAGSKVLQLDFYDGRLKIGDVLQVSRGRPNEESCTVAGFGSVFGSVVLREPLLYDHAPGEEVLFTFTPKLAGPFRRAINQISPQGGPLRGGTALTVTGRNGDATFVDLGDAKCRFGVVEVPAIANGSTLYCDTPVCESPRCVDDARPAGYGDERTSVSFEVTMDGVLFTRSSRRFTYYDMGRTVVSAVHPWGGPVSGGNPLTVSGEGFGDYSGKVAGSKWHGLRCNLAGSFTNASRALGGFEALCETPPANTAIPWPLEPLPLKLTLNGQTSGDSLTTSSVGFSYYNDTAFNVARLHPLGGPTAGGTKLSINLAAEDLHTDLGGLICRFEVPALPPRRGEQTVRGGRLRLARRIEVAAEIEPCENATIDVAEHWRASCSGDRVLTCLTPPLGAGEVVATLDVVVEVSINGQNFTTTASTFTYYDPLAWRVTSVLPRGGPTGGGTMVRLAAPGALALGDPRCRFGDLMATVEATVYGPTDIWCGAPPLWRRDHKYDRSANSSSEALELSLSLNGQDYLAARAPVPTYTYYALDFALGLSVREISPDGGPHHGGTLVTVSGTGFVDHAAILCLFGGADAPVRATWADDTHVLCVSPNVSIADLDATHVHRERRANHRATLLGHAAVRSLEVTVNGYVADATRAEAVDFVYYEHAELRVSFVYPHGGPTRGGTPVTVWGRGFGELDGGAGLHCSFGDDVPMVAAHALLTPGFEDAQTLVCLSAASDEERSVVVRVTNNGDRDVATTDPVGFTYFDSRHAADVGYSTPDYHVFLPPPPSLPPSPPPSPPPPSPPPIPPPPSPPPPSPPPPSPPPSPPP